jgi:hypothetical protein
MRHLVAAKLIIILAAADKIAENAPKVTTRYANIWTSAVMRLDGLGFEFERGTKRELASGWGTRAAAGKYL